MEASFFPYIVAFVWIGFFLLLGSYLRAKIKILQKLLMPSALIGGILGFIALNLGLVGVPTTKGWLSITPAVFSMISFHLFAFGFVGIGLLQNNKTDENTSKTILKGSIWFASVFSMLWAVQALLGFGIFSFYQDLFGGEFFTGNGYLLGAGFTQGPGQSQAYGFIWEENYAIMHAVSTGLAFAAIGFLVAGLVGVPFTLYGIKHNWLSNKNKNILSNEFVYGLMNKGNNPPCAHTTTHPANIDNFSFHLAIMVFIYGLAYLWAIAWASYMPTTLSLLGFGMLFFWGMFIAIFLRKVMEKAKCMHLLDIETTKRCTGITIDFMLCAIFMGITLADLEAVAVPFIIACILGTIVTFAICLWFGRRTTEYGFERMITLFGYCTGTAASGILLLRIVDPDFETPVAIEIGLMNAWCYFILLPITWGFPFAPNEGFSFVWFLVPYVFVTPFIMIALKLISRKKVF